MADESSRLDILPDVAVLRVLHHLPTRDVINLSKVNHRLQLLCTEKDAVQYTKLEGCYQIGEQDLREYLSTSGHNVQVLNLNHCYWVSQRFIQWAVSQCKSLKQLHVIECRLRIDSLVNMISAIPTLTGLAFSISSFTDIKKDVFSPAVETLKNLRLLHVYYTSRELTTMNYLGEHTTVLDYCDNLEHLMVGSAGMAVPELCRPIITDPKQHVKLKRISITNNIHAGAQMFFYGTLSQLPNAEINWKTLVMPNVNFEEFTKKSEFISCLNDMESLEELDVSGSKVTFPTQTIKMEKAVNLRYLNLRMSLITSQQLKLVAEHCHNLVSVNLYGCQSVFKKEGGEIFDGSGLEALFQHCPNLQHLNIAGEHHHVNPIPASLTLGKTVSQIKGLKSLALPTCLLCYPHPSHGTRSSKRTLAALPDDGRPPYKRRQGYSTSYEPEASTSRRQSSASIASPNVAFLSVIVANNPLLTELEIVAVKFDSVFQRNRLINPKMPQFNPCSETRYVRDVILEAVSQLKHLKKLTLAGLPGLTSGQGLLRVAEGCPNLEALSIAYVGGSSFSGSLGRAFATCKNLKDLRVEQPHMSLSSHFFANLRQCTHLQRACIIAKHSEFHQQDVLKLMDQLPKLCILQLFAGNTITSCKTLASMITKRHGKSRPGLSIKIYPLYHDGVGDVVANMPAKHLEELTRFDSRVCHHPPRG